MSNIEPFLTCVCIALILYITLKPKLNNFENHLNQQNQQITQKPDDLFSDGLDHNMGLNKKHRHHSF